MPEFFLIALVGFFIVFMVLLLICGAIKVMGWILGKLGKSDPHNQCIPASSSVQQKVSAIQRSDSGSAISDELLLALITSALMEENGWSGEEFQFLSIEERAV